MPNFYVRSSNDPTGTHNPYPGYQHNAADAAGAALQYLAAHPGTVGKLIVVPESAIACFDVVVPPVQANPGTLPTYS